MNSFTLGTRVTRAVYLDDGTWLREGDPCLKRSPLRHGLIVAYTIAGLGQPDKGTAYEVIWDDKPTQISRGYFNHGLDREA